ncbi:hypothetical protein Ancab_026193 [Ancistrocladus abbreviatus]
MSSLWTGSTTIITSLVLIVADNMHLDRCKLAHFHISSNLKPLFRSKCMCHDVFCHNCVVVFAVLEFIWYNFSCQENSAVMLLSQKYCACTQHACECWVATLSNAACKWCG